MKQCPACQRTYPDDTMSNCMHDGTQLVFAQYNPQAIPQPSAPVQSAPNYPPQPAGYAPYANNAQYPGQQQGYPSPAYATGAGEFAPCPKCQRTDPEKVKFTWWGGLLGPKLLKHVKCRGCGTGYNSKTGADNTTTIVIIMAVSFLLAFLVVFFALRG